MCMSARCVATFWLIYPVCLALDICPQRTDWTTIIRSCFAIIMLADKNSCIIRDAIGSAQFIDKSVRSSLSIIHFTTEFAIYLSFSIVPIIMVMCFNRECRRLIFHIFPRHTICTVCCSGSGCPLNCFISICSIVYLAQPNLSLSVTRLCCRLCPRIHITCRHRGREVSDICFSVFVVFRCKEILRLCFDVFPNHY